MKNGTIFGGVIASILLGLYAFATVVACLTAFGYYTENGETIKQLSSGYATVLNLVGGLVSALVVAVLATTPPKESPSTRFATDANSKSTLNFVIFAYISIWLICGLAMFIIGSMLSSVIPLKELVSAGNSWLGLAIASAYAYLGINPSSNGKT